MDRGTEDAEGSRCRAPNGGCDRWMIWGRREHELEEAMTGRRAERKEARKKGGQATEVMRQGSESSGPETKQGTKQEWGIRQGERN